MRDKENVAVVVGRFQFIELDHYCHHQLEMISKEHDRVVVIMESSPLRNTIRNPLDFHTRYKMLKSVYPDFSIYYIENTINDSVWSNNLDEQIEGYIGQDCNVFLYGAEKSFSTKYSGKYRSKAICVESELSTEGIKRLITREEAENNITSKREYRLGLFAAAASRFPTAYQTVDIAILSEDNKSLLLGRKSIEKKWRFIGGFSDPGSESLEDDARREVQEEAGIEVGDVKYLGSTKVDDWRYRGEIDCIKTAFFVTTHLSGEPKADDDIAEVKWFEIEELEPESLVPNHIKLFALLKKHLEK